MIISENYLSGFFSRQDTRKARGNRKGTKCGQGYISSKKKCRRGKGAEVKSPQSGEAEQKRQQQIETAKKVGGGAAAGIAIGVIGASAYGMATTMESRQKKSRSQQRGKLSSKPTPRQNQTYDKSFPSDREFNRATLTPLSNPPSSGGQKGVNQTFSTEIKGKQYFVKTPSRAGGVFGQIAAAKEVASYDVAKSVGIGSNFLPIKRFTKDETEYLASPMLKQDDLKRFESKNELHEAIANIPEEKASDFLLFDYVMGFNARHDGNILFKKDGNPVIIDNGSIRRDVQLPNKKIRDTSSLKLGSNRNIFFQHSFDGNADATLSPESIKRFTKNKEQINKAIENRYSGLPEKVVYQQSKKTRRKIELLEKMSQDGDTRIRRLIRGK